MKTDSGIEIATPYDVRRFNTAKALSTSSKVKEGLQDRRKSLINLHEFVLSVVSWQKERPPLYETDLNIELLTILLLGEIEEINDHRQLEGLSGYDFKSEKGETIDVGFFLAAFAVILQSRGEFIDYHEALLKANGQASGSKALESLKEVGGNVQEKTLTRDLQYLWTLWISYLIHMKYPVSPTQVLSEYTFPKNNGNYVRELLQGNPIFESRENFNRKMNREEKIAYFAHYRKAMRLIRDFILTYVDPNVEHTGLRPEHYRPYKLFIYSFMNFRTVGLNPPSALEMLESQLYTDYNVPRTPRTPVILRPNTKLAN